MGCDKPLAHPAGQDAEAAFPPGIASFPPPAPPRTDASPRAHAQRDGHRDGGAPGAALSSDGGTRSDHDASRELACGTDGGPDCPLRAWMKRHLEPPLERGDVEGVGGPLLALAKHAPEGYAHWGSIAADGARAARAMDLRGVQAACRTCHELYRKPYQIEHQKEPPPAWP